MGAGWAQKRIVGGCKPHACVFPENLKNNRFLSNEDASGHDLSSRCVVASSFLLVGSLHKTAPLPQFLTTERVQGSC